MTCPQPRSTVNLDETKRRSMPQVDNPLSLIRRIREEGVSCKVEMVPINTLKRYQEDLDMEKVRSMDPRKQSERWFLISQDSKILDGHHGIAALRAYLPPDGTVKVIRVGLVGSSALALVSKLTGSGDPSAFHYPIPDDQTSATPTEEMNPTTPKSTKTGPVCFIPGRYCPMHEGHYMMYRQMANKFGLDNTYIVVSAKEDFPRTPLSADKRKDFICTAFTIPSDHVLIASSPYDVLGHLKQIGRDPESSQAVVALSDKDAARLENNSYFSYLGSSKEPTCCAKDGGYYCLADTKTFADRQTDATYLRSLASGIEGSEEAFVNSFRSRRGVRQMYRTLRIALLDRLADIPTSTINESLDTILSPPFSLKNFSEGETISESTDTTTSAGMDVDDGPATFYRNIGEYKKQATSRAEFLGWEVLSYIVDREDYVNHKYRYNIVSMVSYGQEGGERYMQRVRGWVGKVGGTLLRHVRSINGEAVEVPA